MFTVMRSVPKLVKKFIVAITLLCSFMSFAQAASDDRGDATAVTMPFVEVVDNSSFSADADLALACSLNDFVGDFFYRYTPAADLTLNIKAVGDDARVVVATSDLSDCLIDSDNDLIVSPNWWTINYPELVEGSSCNGDCNENVNVDLTGGVEYLIAIASLEEEALGNYCVSMAEGSYAAIAGSSPNCLPTRLDNLDNKAAAEAVTMPFVEVVDNSSFSADADLALACSPDDFVGDFFYRYTPAADLTLNIKAVGDDARVVVATSDLSDCLIDSDDDLIVSPNWWTINYPELVEGSSCNGNCNENVNVDLTGGVEYLIAIASYEEEALGNYCVSMAEGSDAAVIFDASPTCQRPTPVPTLPLFGLLALGGLLGLFGLRKLKQ